MLRLGSLGIRSPGRHRLSFRVYFSVGLLVFSKLCFVLFRRVGTELTYPGNTARAAAAGGDFSCPAPAEQSAFLLAVAPD